jgi:competence protein ComEC
MATPAVLSVIHPPIRRALLACTLACLGLLLPASAQNLEVHVINVEQGLSVFVRSPSGTRCLIDAGNPGDGTALVRPYLQSIGVSALDTTWMTHWHTDHFGGLTDLFNSGYKPLLAAYDRGDTNKPSNSFVTQYSSAVAGKRQIATMAAGAGESGKKGPH